MNVLFDKNPAFTVGQLKALVTPDIFEVINWPEIFGICATPLQQALDDLSGSGVLSRSIGFLVLSKIAGSFDMPCS